ncbi:SprB repeat-containing protein [Bernardetia sp.]|uniref:SprB repeat-containing protein n=1 Tax=Bernardetia sp. TaxID=1937974 RepID=UPI0025BB12B6|nr:SprB repeat-containing protein [Bernardetia sp.]
MKNNSFLSLLFLTVFSTIVLFACGGSDEPEPTPDPDPIDTPCSSPPTLSLTAENTSCTDNTGKITATGAGGTGTLTYQLGSGDFQSSGIFENLAAGEYTVTVKDAEGCTTSQTATIENADAPTISLTSEDAGCGTNDGSITVIANGGSGSYQYSLDGGAFQSNATFSNLAIGTYRVTLKDTENCEATAEVTLTTGVNYVDNVASIINTNCAISGCHSGGQAPSLTSFDEVSRNSSRVLARASSRSMPPQSSGLSLTDEEIQLIECWVEDGTPRN